MDTKLLYLSGIGLYVLWVLAVLMKFSILPKNRSFSYRSAFFGTIAWYKNWRNWLLIMALFLLELFAPLKSIFLLICLTGFLFSFLCGNNFRLKIGNPWLGLGLILLFFCLGLGAASFLYLF